MKKENKKKKDLGNFECWRKIVKTVKELENIITFVVKIENCLMITFLSYIQKKKTL